MTPREELLLRKLVKIQSISPQCLHALLKAARRSRGFREALQEVERLCGKPLQDFEKEELLPHLAAGHQLLRDLFTSQPLLSEMSPHHVAIFASLADYRPGPDGRPESGDSVFVRIARMVADQGGTPDVNQILEGNFSKLIGINSKHPEVLNNLVALSRTPHFSGDLRVLDQYFDSLNAGKNVPLAKCSPEARKIARVLVDPSAGTLLPQSRFFLAVPRLSHLPAGQVAAYAEIRDKLTELLAADNDRSSIVAAESYRWRVAASKALDLLDQDRRKEVVETIELRWKVAQHFLERRKFAKMQAFENAWSDLSRRIRVDGLKALRSLEKAVLTPKTMGLEALPGFKEYIEDEKLRRFLGTPPLFQEIANEELADFFALSERLGEARTSTVPDEYAEAPVETPLHETPFENLNVKIEVEGEVMRVMVTSDFADEAKTVVTIPFDTIQQLSAELGQTYIQSGIYTSDNRSIEGPAASGDQDQLRLHIRIHSDRLRELGTKLFECIFGTKETRRHLQSAPESSRVRIVFLTRDAKVLSLPWESLYFADLDIHPALTLKFSVVRLVGGSDQPTRLMRPPLRILAVLSSPEDAPLPEAEKEAAVLRQTLAQGLREGHVSLRVLEKATKEELLHELRVFQPHVFHFMGHGVLEQGQGHLALSDERGRISLIASEALAVVLRDHRISLAVLNGCETGLTKSKHIVNSVAQSIAYGGIPATVATTRNIVDAAGLMFTREFYRSLVDGYPLESALVESRKALYLKHWDWSAYALFASTRNLGDLGLRHPAKQRN